MSDIRQDLYFWAETQAECESDRKMIRRGISEIDRLRRELTEIREKADLHRKVCFDCGLSWYDPKDEISCPRCKSSSRTAADFADADAAAAYLRELASSTTTVLSEAIGVVLAGLEAAESKPSACMAARGHLKDEVERLKAPRPRPDREALAKIQWEAWKSEWEEHHPGGTVDPWDELTETEKQHSRNVVDVLAAALDAAPPPSGTGKPAAIVVRPLPWTKVDIFEDVDAAHRFAAERKGQGWIAEVVKVGDWAWHSSASIPGPSRES